MNRTPKHRILSILKRLDYADQVKILESVQKSLRITQERKERHLSEWIVETKKSNRL
jgi:hypothetical protein